MILMVIVPNCNVSPALAGTKLIGMVGVSMVEQEDNQEELGMICMLSWPR